MANFNYNRIFLGGRLTADPELRQTTTGIPMVTFSIAVSRRTGRSQQDQNQPTADFFNVTCWRERAEFVSRYFRKGSSIFISGTLQNDNWTDSNGVKRYSTRIIADDVNFVDSRSENPYANQMNTAPTQQSQSGYAQQNQSYTPSSYTTSDLTDDSDKQPNFEEIADDESLPF